MTEPAEFNPETTPSISLGGKMWPIPELAWRDLKKCRKELLELTKLINAAISATETVEGEEDAAKGLRNLATMSSVFQDLSNEDFDRLVMGPIHAGLCALHPQLPRSEMEGWSSTEADRQLAWITVRRQSGLFLKREGEGTQDKGPGEETGGQSPS